jgi:predicted esterase
LRSHQHEVRQRLLLHGLGDAGAFATLAEGQEAAVEAEFVEPRGHRHIEQMIFWRRQ